MVPLRNRRESGASAYRDASGIIVKGSVRIVGVILTSGTDVASLTLYDGVDANGELKTHLKTIANYSKDFNFPCCIECRTGIYCSLTGTSPDYVVFFEPLDCGKMDE